MRAISNKLDRLGNRAQINTPQPTSSPLNPNQGLPNHRAKYSPVQYFFWMIAGSEISVLKNCPTDYNRHASIGFTIFMTCMFAGFAGYLAGYSIGGNNEIAGIAFGTIWAFLIFSIDRSMVVSLKKNPTARRQSVFKFLIPRALLAGLIAFIISIPLETKVFEEEITIQMQKDKLLEKEAFLNDYTRLEDIEGKKGAIASQKSEIGELEALLNAPCPTAKCQELRTLVSQKSSEVSTLQAQKDAQQTKVNNARYKVPLRPILDSLGNVVRRVWDRSTPEWRRYSAAVGTMNTIKKNYNKADGEL
ncbi:MAG: DUF4407 domain-containing protein, partial [Pseudomonadota bacterium]